MEHYFWVCLWKCFWKRLAFESVDWVKFNVGRHHLVHQGSKWNKKAEGEQILSLFWSWDTHLLLPSDIRTPVSVAFGLWHLHQWPPGSQVFDLRLGVTTLSLLVLRLLDLVWIIPRLPWFTSLQMTHCGVSQPLGSREPIPIINLTYTAPTGSVSLENPN